MTKEILDEAISKAYVILPIQNHITRLVRQLTSEERDMFQAALNQHPSNLDELRDPEDRPKEPTLDEIKRDFLELSIEAMEHAIDLKQQAIAAHLTKKLVNDSAPYVQDFLNGNRPMDKIAADYKYPAGI